MAETAITFSCHGERLIGILHKPPVSNNSIQLTERLAFVFVVGGPQYRIGSHRQFVVMARSLTMDGYPVFRFDHRGIGDSSGEMRSFEDIGDDIEAAVGVVRRELPDHEIVMLGLCDAASTLLMHVSKIQNLAALILLNPWVRTEEGLAETYARHYYLQRLISIEFWRKVFLFEWNIKASVAGLIGTAGMLLSKKQARQEEGVTFIERMYLGLLECDCPVLFILSGKDYTAREFELLLARDERWKESSREPRVEFARLDNADHTFSGERDLTDLHSTLVRWLAQHDYSRVES